MAVLGNKDKNKMKKAGEKSGKECQALKSLVTKPGRLKTEGATGGCYTDEFSAGVYVSERPLWLSSRSGWQEYMGVWTTNE